MSELSPNLKPSHATPQSPRNWGRFLEQFQKDVKLWLCVFLVLWGFRWLMIFIFRQNLSELSKWTDLFRCSFIGARFDAVVATCWLLPCLALSVACGFSDLTRTAERMRRVVSILYFSLTALLCVITVGYFQEYKNQFDRWIFGTIFDDRRAILSTIWTEHHIVVEFLGVGSLVALVIFGVNRFLRHPFVSAETLVARLSHRWARIGINLAIVLLVVGGLRGSFGLQRVRFHNNADIFPDPFLPAVVMNPYVALRYAIRDYHHLTTAKGFTTFLPDHDVRKALKRIYPHAPDSNNLDDYLKKTACGLPGPKPKHIFLVVMESYDGWAMLPEYESLGLTPQLSALAKKGIYVKSFVSAGDGTMFSLSALVTGLADVGVFTNHQPSAQKPYPTSIAPIFKRLGYTTRFYYGGYRDWQRTGDFCRDQGFDEDYDGADIIKRDPTIQRYDWGVHDEFLFRYIQETLPEDPPSFNLILSTSYHPPFSLDVFKRGYATHEIPAALKNRYDGKVGLNAFGHLWYADQCLGNFVTEFEKKQQHSLFAITGDHYSRRFLNARPSLFERTAVPLVLYGPAVLSPVISPAKIAGGHMDIAPTLIELSAPMGFEYHSLGGNLLDPLRTPLGLGRQRVIGPNFVMDVTQPQIVEAIPGQTMRSLLPDAEHLKQTYLATHALAWWRIMKGSDLTPRP